MGIDRHSYIAVNRPTCGGLDMAGFCGSDFHRGIPVDSNSTTVLSQNDSAVGVKNSINAWQKKIFFYFG